MTDPEKISQYLRNHWPLSEIAAILDDSREPITFRTLQSWVTGQVLRIKPSLVVPGQKRKRYGIASLLNFIIAKRLLQVSGLPAPAVQSFIDRYGDEEFMKGFGYTEKMEGYFLVIQDGPKDAKFLFFKDEEKFFSAVRIFISAPNAPKWTTLRLHDLLDEALERLDCWSRRVEYRPVTAGDQARKALNAIRDANLAKDMPANASIKD